MEARPRASISQYSSAIPPPLNRPPFSGPVDNPPRLADHFEMPVRAEYTTALVVYLSSRNPLTANNYRLLYYLSSTRYRQEPKESIWARHSKKQFLLLCRVFSLYPYPEAAELIATPIGWLNGFINLALLGNSLALTEHDGTQGGLPFMMLRLDKRKREQSPEVIALRKQGNWTALPHQANERLLMSADGLNKNEMRIYLMVLRETIGRGIIRARISTSLFARKTGLAPRRIRQSLKLLQEYRVLKQTARHSRYPKIAKEWEIEFSPEEWRLGDKSVQRTKPIHSQRLKLVPLRRTKLCTSKDSSHERSREYIAEKESLNSHGVKIQI